jgi:hypothetical protein
MNIVFEGEVRCLRGADGNSMQLRGLSHSMAGRPPVVTDFFCQGTGLPPLPDLLADVSVRELDAASHSGRRFELRGNSLQLEIVASAAQLHRDAGRAMFDVIPRQPVPAWLRAAWWLLLSVLRIPGIGRLLRSSGSTA